MAALVLGALEVDPRDPRVAGLGEVPRLVLRRAHADSLLQQHGESVWVAGLSSVDPSLRIGAARALGRYGRPEANTQSLLRERLTHEGDPAVQMALVEALVRLGGDAQLAAISPNVGAPPARSVATAPLMARPLDHEVPETYAAIFSAQAPTLTVPRALALARVVIMSPSPAIAQAARRALAEAPDEAFAAALGELRGRTSGAVQLASMLRAIGLRGDPRYASRVREALGAQSEPVLEAALEAAATLRLVELGPLVLGIARANNAVAREARSPLRAQALRVAGVLGERLAPEELRGYLAMPTLRAAAIDASVSAGNLDAVAPIAGLLEASWVEDRRAAIEALGALGGPAAVSALLRGLEREREAAVRDTYFHALARIGGREARRAIERAAWLAEPEAMNGAAEWWLRWREGPALAGASAAALRRGVPAALRWAVCAMSDAGYARLVALLGATDRAARIDASAALALVPAEAGLPRAVEERLAAVLVTERDEAVRDAMLVAASRFAPRSEALREAMYAGLVLDEFEGELDSATLHAALWLGGAGDARVEPVLRAALASRRPFVRAAAGYALSNALGARARVALERAVESELDAPTRGALAQSYARAVGPAAHPLLARLSRTAWSAELAEALDRAQQIARGVRAPFSRGESLVRVRAATPGTLSSAWLPDGSPRAAVAFSDGALWMIDAISSGVSLGDGGFS